MSHITKLNEKPLVTSHKVYCTQQTKDDVQQQTIHDISTPLRQEITQIEYEPPAYILYNILQWL